MSINKQSSRGLESSLQPSLLPEPELDEEEPLVVEDEEFSHNEPTIDRGILVQIIVKLSIKIHEALKIDNFVNKRYARRLVLINHLRIDGYSRSKKRRPSKEKFLIKLPIEAMSWNEFESIDIQDRLLRAVVDINDCYSWFKVKVHLDHFISEETKKMMEESDDETDYTLLINEIPSPPQIDLINIDSSKSSSSVSVPVPNDDDDDDEPLILKVIERAKRIIH